ncbi:MAG TPA: hypothetical protein VHU83_22900 [Bryobacteraceae bacterium]|jgi:hypothetical protein|nr:hypothetical protein [Bryobacteraceae bacterium]
MRFEVPATALALLISSSLYAQPAKRIAVIVANGLLERANPLFAMGKSA